MVVVEIFYILLALMFKVVLGWTVDLSEVVRLDHDDPRGEYGLSKHNKYIYESYNVQNGLYDANQVYDDGKYAEAFQYQSYMDSRVQELLLNGSRYLEGLREALVVYTEKLKNCTTVNSTSFHNDSTQNTGSLFPNPLTFVNLTVMLENFTDPEEPASCEAASQKYVYVKELVELALWTTREIQQKSLQKDEKMDMEDDMLSLLRLAWLLDKLAQITGYKPHVDDLPPTTTDTLSTSTTSPEKLEHKSPKKRIPDNVPQSSILVEILRPKDKEQLLSKLPSILTAVKSVRPIRSIRKRSIDEATLKLMKYYIKHKAWVASNTEELKNDEFDVSNHLTTAKSVQKRSVNEKISRHIPISHPLREIGDKLKSKARAHILEGNHGEKNPIIEGIRRGKSFLAKIHVRELSMKLKLTPKHGTADKVPVKEQPKLKDGPVLQAVKVKLGL